MTLWWKSTIEAGGQIQVLDQRVLPCSLKQSEAVQQHSSKLFYPGLSFSLAYLSWCFSTVSWEKTFECASCSCQQSNTLQQHLQTFSEKRCCHQTLFLNWHIFSRFTCFLCCKMWVYDSCSKTFTNFWKLQEAKLACNVLFWDNVVLWYLYHVVGPNHSRTCVIKVNSKCMFMGVPPHLPLLAPSLGLQGPCALFNTLREAHAAVIWTVVQLRELSQRQDVIAGYT